MIKVTLLLFFIHITLWFSYVMSVDQNLLNSTAFISRPLHRLERRKRSLRGRKLESNVKPISVDQIDEAIGRAKALLGLIHSRYEYDTPRGKLFVTMQSNMKEKDFDLLKLIFLKKLTSTNPKYKMVFGGSSVTAGHDSLFQHSHPKVLERRMRPVFDALGIDFVVHNIAQGANDCVPFNMCLDAMAGEGGDFYLWEQSFNCGRDLRTVEMVIRQAARNEGSVYIMSSGGVSTKTCAPSKEPKPLRSDEIWVPSSPVALTAEKVAQFKNDLIEINKLGQSVGSRVTPLLKRYAIGPSSSGMNVFLPFPASVCEGIKPPLKVCDIPTLMEGCPDLKFLSREASEYALGGGASHHPSRAMHMMRGEIIAWSYTIALFEALVAFRQELTTGKVLSDLHAGYSETFAKQQGPIPQPMLCGGDPYYCEESYKCFTEYSPKYTEKYSLKELVVNSIPPSKWAYVVHPIQKRQSDRINPSDKEMRNHYATREGPKAGEIFFKINIVSEKVGRVLVCWEGIDKKTPMERIEYRFDLNVGDVALSPNYTYYPKPNRSAWESKVHMYPCMSLHNLPMGIHILGLESKGGYVGVSHIVTWFQGQ